MKTYALSRAKRAATAVLSRVPESVWERVFPKDVLALGYHVVSDEELPHLKLYAYKTLPQFESDVVFARGRTIEYDRVANHRLRGTPLPANQMLFTFDDGLAECFHNVRPILRKHGVSGVFFVPSNFIDDREPFHEVKLALCISEIEKSDPDRLLGILQRLSIKLPVMTGTNDDRASKLLASPLISKTLRAEQRQLLRYLVSLWHDHEPELDELCELLGVDAGEYARRRQVFMTAEQLSTMASEGFTIGGHSLNHHMLQTMTREQVENEIVSSCQSVREITNQKHVPFAFPYGGQNIDRSFLADILARHPFIDLIFDSGSLRRDAPFIVDRVWADSPTGTPGVSNLPLALRRAWSSPPAWFAAQPAMMRSSATASAAP